MMCFLRIPVGLFAGLLLVAGGGCGRNVAEHDNLRGAEDPVAVSAAIMVDPAPVQVPVPGIWPAIAFGENQYLVVWEDHREARPILYGGRIAADGTALDPHGFVLLDAGVEYGLEVYESVVAFDGGNFLVVANVYGRIIGVRVSPAGEVLDPTGILIATSASPISEPALVFDGEQFRVAWSVGHTVVASEGGIYSARVTRDGAVLETNGVRAYELESENRAQVAVSSDGSNCLLSWMGRHDIEAGRIGPDGTPIDATPLHIEPLDVSYAGMGRAGFDGTNHVIAWVGSMGEDVTEDVTFEQRLMASRVTPAGALLDPHGIVLDTQLSGTNRLDMTAGDGQSILVWSRDIFADEYHYAAEPIRVIQLATDGTASSHPANELAVGLQATLAIHPDGGLLLWRDGDFASSTDTPLVGTLLDAAGAPVAGSVVVPASTTNRQELMAAASDGQGFFVLWSDTRYPTGEGPALFGARLAADGTPLDPTPLRLTDKPTALANVVFDGASYVVTWTDEFGYFSTVRVSPAGERLDATPLRPPLYSDETLTGASDGTHTLLIGSAPGGVLGAVLVDQSGVIGEVIHIPPDPEDTYESAFNPTVSFDGTGYLLVWQDVYTVFGQRISTSGALEGQRFTIVEGFDEIDYLAASGGDGEHLVVWKDEQRIAAIRVGPNGELHEVGPVAAALQATCCHSVTFDGHSFIVGWRALADADDESSADLYATLVSTDGEVLQQFPISREPGAEESLIVVAANGRVLAAYDQLMPGPPYDNKQRVLARLITP